MENPKYKRVLLKISGEALAGEASRGLDFNVIGEVCDVVKRCVQLGVQVGIVVGGGNFWRGLKDGGDRMVRVRADHMGMLATAINALAVADVLEQKGVEVRVQTAIEMRSVAEPYIRQTVKNPDLNVAEIAGLLQARCEKLTDIPEKVDFFDALPDYDVNLFANKKSKSTLDSSKEMLSAAIGMLANLPSWSEAMIHDSLVGLAEGLGVKNALLMWPVRIAAAGTLVTPGGAMEILTLLGREEALRRLRLGLEKLKG